MNRPIPSKRSKRAIIMAGALLALGVAASAYFAGRPRPALQSARTFCVVQPWSGQQLTPTSSHYYWLSDREALIVPDLNAAGPSTLFRVALDAAGRAGRPIPLPRALPTGDESCLCVSPNGRYLAYSDTVMRADGRPDTSLVVRGLDGQTVLTRDMGAVTHVGPFAWSPDSRSVMVLQFRDRWCLRRLSIETGRDDTLLLPVDLNLSYPGNDTIVGVTDHGTVLLAKEGLALQNRAFFASVGSDDGQSNVNYPRVSLIELSLSDHPRVVRKLYPRVPAGIGCGIIALSPRGDQLFWGALCANRPSPLETRLHRFLAFVPADTEIVERGWVSRLDGSGTKEIGYYSIPVGAPGPGRPAGAPWIIDPKWTPDGKRISFVYKDRLLTIPAE